MSDFIPDIARISQILAKRRRSLGLSQNEFAGRLEISQGQISEIEAGKRNFGVKTLIDFARAVGLEVVLVPRTLLPAVAYLIQDAPAKSEAEQQSKYEFWNEDEGAGTKGKKSK